jgi:hypothetical protein
MPKQPRIPMDVAEMIAADLPDGAHDALIEELTGYDPLEPPFVPAKCKPLEDPEVRRALAEFQAVLLATAETITRYRPPDNLSGIVGWARKRAKTINRATDLFVAQMKHQGFRL